ncbi:MAG TPA: hypothetical protein VFX68_03725 [Sulfuricurvum sp.]|nr:hypothetical protein [Sulfuricurvum sp.]
MKEYPLKTILSTFSTSSGKKRTIYNLGPIGGLSSTAVILFFMSLPFIEYAILFNPYVFNKLGIAQAIVFYIVFLSLIMIAIFLIAWKIKMMVIKKINPSWNHYFEHIDLNMVLSSGITPYSQFFDYYAQGIKEKIPEDALQNYLLDACKSMEKENHELIAAMNRNKNSH